MVVGVGGVDGKRKGKKDLILSCQLCSEREQECGSTWE